MKVTPTRINEIANMSETELLTALVRVQRGIASEISKKKTDTDLAELTSFIKKYRDDKTPDEVKQLTAQIKELKKEVDAGIEEELEDKKILTKEFNDSIKSLGNERSLIMQKLSQLIK